MGKRLMRLRGLLLVGAVLRRRHGRRRQVGGLGSESEPDAEPAAAFGVWSLGSGEEGS